MGVRRMSKQSPGVPLKSHDRTAYQVCPNCKSPDVRGPIDTAPSGPLFHFTRSWFCRSCWWDTSKKLRDDIAEKASKDNGKKQASR
jgi:hypothetical protein